MSQIDRNIAYNLKRIRKSRNNFRTRSNLRLLQITQAQRGPAYRKVRRAFFFAHSGQRDVPVRTSRSGVFSPCNPEIPAQEAVTARRKVAPTSMVLFQVHIKG